jgi:hypothetical protein
MQVIHIHIITIKYKNFKMIKLIHMIFILNSAFFHCVIHDEMNKIRSHLHIFFKKLKQLNLLYI